MISCTTFQAGWFPLQSALNFLETFAVSSSPSIFSFLSSSSSVFCDHSNNRTNGDVRLETELNEHCAQHWCRSALYRVSLYFRYSEQVQISPLSGIAVLPSLSTCEDQPSIRYRFTSVTQNRCRSALYQVSLCSRHSALVQISPLSGIALLPSLRTGADQPSIRYRFTSVTQNRCRSALYRVSLTSVTQHWCRSALYQVSLYFRHSALVQISPLSDIALFPSLRTCADQPSIGYCFPPVTQNLCRSALYQLSLDSRHS